MIIRKAKIPGVKNIIQFVQAANKVPCNIDIHYGRKYLDAKSAIGVMTIDIRNEFILEIQTSSPEEIKIAEQALDEFIIKD